MPTSPIDLTTIAAGSGGFVIFGQDVGDRSAFSVASAVDINGDGFADLIIGAQLGDAAFNGKLNAGDSYVVFGKASGFGPSIDLASIAAGSGSADVVSAIAYLIGGSASDLLSGDAFANRVEGGAGNDTLFGQEGDDTLIGGLGADSLVGGAGADQFVFDSALNGTTNVDTISDFSVNSDKLVLDDAIFTGLLAGSLSANNFVSNAGGTAGDGNDFILYNSSDGALLYDADGNGGGAAVQFASLAGNPVITFADFAVI